ncbi:hypothetical protein NKI36_18045 [Mesorhizobium caraganae]|uniref:Uncharacterized protein n=1 Tax=Mesorhizobium caraganae TaxID=483206 RepID=A0ABV1Z1P2_9HYPH
MKSKLVRNERLKMSATFFNNLAVAAFATGAILPILSMTAATLWVADPKVILPFLLGSAVGVILHAFAIYQLGSLEE